MNTNNTVLVVGSAGRIGQAVVAELQRRKLPVRGFGVRRGWGPRTPEQVREIAASEEAQDVYLSPGDAGRFFACAVQAKADIRFAIVYASSKPVHHVHFDLEPAASLVGFVPQE